MIRIRQNSLVVNREHSASGYRRPGIAALWLLAVLVVLSSLTAAIVLQQVGWRRTLDHNSRKLQTSWLARAGIELAVARLLDKSSEYKGETAEPIPTSKVQIEVRPVPNSPNTFLVTSEAQYPTNDPRPTIIQLTRQYTRVVEKGTARMNPATPASAK